MKLAEVYSMEGTEFGLGELVYDKRERGRFLRGLADEYSAYRVVERSGGKICIKDVTSRQRQPTIEVDPLLLALVDNPFHNL